MNARKVFIGLCCAFVASSAFAQDALFAKANHDYAEGRFKEAIDSYETLVRSGQWSANLFYDLGNAYFREKDFGRAILNYERALALDRHHPESEANLAIARDEARALEMQPTWLSRHLQSMSLAQFTIAASAAFWIGVFCVTGFIFARRRSARMIALSILSFCVCAVTAFTIYQIVNENRGVAIVTGKEVTARLATADNANSVLALPPGSEIRILSTRGDWVYAGLPNNLRGWIPAKAAEQVRL
jgi:uncharacterized membrane protein